MTFGSDIVVDACDGSGGGGDGDGDNGASVGAAACDGNTGTDLVVANLGVSARNNDARRDDAAAPTCNVANAPIDDGIIIDDDEEAPVVGRLPAVGPADDGRDRNVPLGVCKSVRDCD